MNVERALTEAAYLITSDGEWLQTVAHYQDDDDGNTIIKTLFESEDNGEEYNMTIDEVTAEIKDGGKLMELVQMKVDL